MKGLLVSVGVQVLGRFKEVVFLYVPTGDLNEHHTDWIMMASVPADRVA